MNPRYPFVLAALFLASAMASPASAVERRCRKALVPLSVINGQKNFPPERIQAAYLEGLQVDFSQETQALNGTPLYFTPVSSEVLRFMDDVPGVGFVVRAERDGVRTPVMLITGKVSRAHIRHGTVLNLTYAFPGTSPEQQLFGATYNYLRNLHFKTMSGLRDLGLPFTEVGDGGYFNLLNHGPRFDSNWSVGYVDAAGEQHNNPGSLHLFPSVFFAPNYPYSRELMGQVIPQVRPNDRVLVLGTGSGIDVLRLITEGGVRRVIDAVDINPVAVANTRLNTEFWGVRDHVNASVSDGFESVAGKTYDVIVFDAPLATRANLPLEGATVSLHDPEGRLLRRILTALPTHLAAGGRFYLMASADILPYMAEAPLLKSRLLTTFTEGAASFSSGRSFTFGIHEITRAP